MKTPVQIILEDHRKTEEQKRRDRIRLLMDSLPFFDDANYLKEGCSIRFKEFAEDSDIYGSFSGYFDQLNEGITDKLIKASIARLLLKLSRIKKDIEDEKDTDKRLSLLASMSEINGALSALDPNQSKGVLNKINQIISGSK